MIGEWTRVTLRRRMGSTIVLTLLVGVMGGAALAAAAGARRTDTAYPRLVASTHSNGILISTFGPGMLGVYPEVRKLPEILRSGIIAGVNVWPVTPEGLLIGEGNQGMASVDGGGGYATHGFKILSGRMPDPNAADEILINRAFARLHNTGTGHVVAMRLFGANGPKDPDHVRPDEGIPMKLRVTALGVTTEEVVPVSPLDSFPRIFLTPAWWKRYGDPLNAGFDGMLVELKRGVSVGAFEQRVEAIAAKHSEVGNAALFSIDAEHHARVERAIRPQAAALAAFAAITALVSVLVLGQALARHVTLDAVDYPILKSLGTTRGQLFTATMIRVGVVTFGGTLIAVALAIGASRFTPIGPARVAEPSPGVAVNAAIVGIGAAALALALTLWASVTAWRTASVRAGNSDIASAQRAVPSRVVAAVRRASRSASMTAGVQMALEPGRGRSAVPVRSALAGTAIAVGALVASLVFGANLNRMVSEPRSFGWDWDLMVDGSFGVLPTVDLNRILNTDSSVEAWSAGAYGSIRIGGRDVAAIGVDQKRGFVYPTLISGRAATASDEIVLGPRTLRETRAHIGDQIDVVINTFEPGRDRHTRLRIVGTAVFPSIGRGAFTPTGLGDGAAMAAKPLVPPDIAQENGGQSAGDIYSFAFVRLRKGTSAAAAGRLTTALTALRACADQDCQVAPNSARRPADISNYGRVRGTPLLLAGMLFVLASLMIGHTLVTAVKRRGTDLAVLKTLGFSRWQVSSTVAWQASTFALFSVVIGVPAGVALGRWTWTAFANQLGVPPSPIVTAASILVPLGATFALANLVASLPARSAGRIRPAIVLRTE